MSGPIPFDGYLTDHDEFESPSGPVLDFTAALSDEARVSVAEEAMERAGYRGRTIQVPVGHVDDPEHQAALAPLTQWVRSLTDSPHTKIYASDYMLDQAGAQAMVNEYGSIIVRSTTNELIVLHEVAHVRSRTQHGRGGHGPEFRAEAERLYRQHLGDQAADMFVDLATPPTHTSAKRRRGARGFKCMLEGPRAREIYERMARDAATVDDILYCATYLTGNSVGDQWGMDDSEFGPNWEDNGAEDYAYVDYDMFVRQFGAEEIEDGGEPTGELSVILVGYTDAQYTDASWDAAIPHGSIIELTEVRYNAGWGWKRLPANGKRVTAALDWRSEGDAWVIERDGLIARVDANAAGRWGFDLMRPAAGGGFEEIDGRGGLETAEDAKSFAEAAMSQHRTASVGAYQHPLVDDLSELSEAAQAEVMRQLAMIPSDAVSFLVGKGVRVLGVKKAGRGGAIDYGGLWDFNINRVVLSTKFLNDQSANGTLTVLHELGHALDWKCGRVAKMPAFRALWKDAKPRPGSYFAKAMAGSSDPRQELLAEAIAAIWGRYTPRDFTVTPYLRELEAGMRRDLNMPDEEWSEHEGSLTSLAAAAGYTTDMGDLWKQIAKRLARPQFQDRVIEMLRHVSRLTWEQSLGLRVKRVATGWPLSGSIIVEREDGAVFRLFLDGQKWRSQRTARLGGIPVEDVRSNGIGSTGRVRSGRPVIAYRGFGSWGEAKDSFARGEWISRGRFTTVGEGDTQMATDLADVLASAGKHGLRGTGFLGYIEADISGLPYESHLEPDANGFLEADLGLGIGIIGGIPLGRIRKIVVINDDGTEGEEMSVAEARSMLAADKLSDRPGWTPEVKDRPETHMVAVVWKDGGRTHRWDQDRRGETAYGECGESVGVMYSRAMIRLGDALGAGGLSRQCRVHDQWGSREREIPRLCETCFGGPTFGARTGSTHTAAGKPLSEMTDSEWSSMKSRVLYHGTSNDGDLEKLLSQGVRMSNVPNNLARQRYKAGENAEYAPGAGAGWGLYASGNYYQASQFGRHVVAIEVSASDYEIPPESTGSQMEWALEDANGVLITKDIPASKVHLVVRDRKRYTADPMESARAMTAARDGSISVPAWMQHVGVDL